MTVFLTNPKGPGVTTAVKHHIDMGSSTPVRCRPHQSSLAEMELIHKEIAEMLKNKVVKQSSSLLAAPVMLAPKSDRLIRFCVDYRQLNSITKKDVHPYSI